MKLYKSNYSRRFVTILVLLLAIVFFLALKSSETVSEYFYARGITRAYVFAVGHVSDLFEFSLFEAFVFVCITVLIYNLTLFFVRLKKKQREKAFSGGLKTITAALSVALIYVLTASGCYARAPLPVDKYEGEQLSDEVYYDIVKSYMRDFASIAATLPKNEKGETVCPYSYDELVSLIQKEYSTLKNDYFSSYTPKAKRLVSGEFFSVNGITGITFVPTGEANVNVNAPEAGFAVTVAHELAHTKGVMRERDANMISYYLLAKSDVPYLRYCAYRESLGYLTGILRILNEEYYKDVMTLYPTEAKADNALESAYWQEKRGFMNKVGKFFNNLYLKLSGVGDGTKNYADPSSYNKEQYETDQGTVTIVKVNYSDTVKMYLALYLTNA